MRPLGSPAPLSSIDRRAAAIGRVCAVVCLASIAGAGILLLLMAGKVVAERSSSDGFWLQSDIRP